MHLGQCGFTLQLYINSTTATT